MHWPFFLKSKKCINKWSVCDGRKDCKFGEDEKSCVNLVNAEAILIKEDGQPLKPHSGLVAVNSRGKWTAACVTNW